MILLPSNKRIIRPYDKPSFEWTQRFGLDKNHPLTPNCVFYGIFNEGSGGQVLDLSGYNNNGTIEGSWTWDGEYLTLPGADGAAIYCGHNDIGIWGSTAMTVLALVNPSVTVPPVEAAQIIRDGNSAGNRVFSLRWLTTGRIDFDIYEDNDNLIRASTADAVMADLGPHFVGGIVNGDDNTVKVYLDGEYSTSGESFTRVLQTNSSGSNDHLLIGAGLYNPSDDTWFGGLKIILLFNRALSSSEIDLLCSEPFCMVKGWGRMSVYFIVPTGAPPSSKPYYYREFASRRVA